jgi:hypothetical protein
MIDTLSKQLNLLFALDSEEFMIIAMMCLLAAFFVKVILQNAMLAIAFYPALVVGALISIRVGREYGLVGQWFLDTVPFLVATGTGMSMVAVVVLSLVAFANRT